MKTIFSLRFGLLALLICLLELPLAASEAAKIPAKSATPPKAEIKLTPAQQRGLRLLQSAEAMAPGLEPGMRTYVLWQVSHGYEKISAARRLALLRDAFRSSTIIGSCGEVRDSACEQKNQLQTSILGELATTPRGGVEEFLPQTDAFVRFMVSDPLVKGYLNEKKFDRAEQFLQSFEQEEYFPYSALMSVMGALPPTRSSDKVALFSLALTNFRDIKPIGFDYVGNDLGALIVQYSEDLPPDLVLEATDVLLDRSRKISEGDRNIQTDMYSEKGMVSLDSYQYRLFQLLPVIRELDAPHAEQLLREQKEISSLFQKYPDGLKSVNGAVKTTTSLYTHSGGPPSPAIVEQQQLVRELGDQTRLKQDAVRTMSSTNPDRALELAAAVPLWPDNAEPHSMSPRATSLLDLADACAKTKPLVAVKALQEVSKALDHMDSLEAGRLVVRAAGIYQKMSDWDHLRNLLGQGMKIAEKAYEKDADSSDPNLASKTEWPSTVFWSRLIGLAAQISPDMAEQLIGEISDPEIQTIEKVSFGNALLGVSVKLIRTTQNHKNSSSSSTESYN